jgi:hypothetical protein
MILQMTEQAAETLDEGHGFSPAGVSALADPVGTGRVPLVRRSVRGPKKTGDPDFLLRGPHQRPRVRLSFRKAA